jgi:hypothetical protein
MKSNQELLEEYTSILNAEWQNNSRKNRIRKELESSAKEDSKRLRVAIRRLIRNTKWTLEKCSYWHLIHHGDRPVTAKLQGSVELFHFRENPRALTRIELSFDPTDEERTLLYLRSIIHTTKS